MRDNIQIVDYCCGCEVCVSVCPARAITIREDDLGFLVPGISGNCISCGKCVQVCPMHNRVPETNENEVYFGISNKDEDVLINSASGGVFTFLRQKFIKKYPNGWVSGVVYKEDFSGVRHILSQSQEDFEKMRSSKYLQSEKTGIYQAIKEKLECGEAVLFSGAACEVDALKRFLGKEYDALWTVDYICKGTTTPKVFRDYSRRLEQKKKSKITCINMRFKWKELDNWIPQFMGVTFENGKRIVKQFYNTEVGLAFLILQRESCKKCPYREKKHYSDFTLGDFHGPVGDKPYGNRLGTSALIINNRHAYTEWMKMDKSSLCIGDSSWEEIYSHNRNPQDERSAKLVRNLRLYDGVTAVRKTVGIKERVKMLLPTKMMRKITMKNRQF